MTNEPYPSALLKPEWVYIIRQHTFAAEEAGMLHPEQLALIYEQQWFKLLVPKAYGGLEAPLPEQIRMEEALSWADGSLGWVVTLCAGAGWFGGFIEADAAREIFADPKVCLAGSGASTGTATRRGNGYVLNGHWKYASGVKHATHFTANCIIQDENGMPELTDNGDPTILPFVINSNQAEQVAAWKYIGMMGTGSHAFNMMNAMAPKNRCFKIEAETAVVDGLLYQYPFLQLAEATLAANLSGMALHFIDLCGPVFEAKIKESQRMTSEQGVFLMETYSHIKENLQQVRNRFYEAVDASWQQNASRKFIPEALNTVSLHSRYLAHAARESVDQLYPFCGLQAASPDTEINQVWRDMHTASQHALLTFMA